MKYEVNLPLPIKILLGIGVVVLFFGIIYNLRRKGKDNMKQFYSNGFSTIVIKSNSFEGRSVEFHLQNGLKIYFMPPLNDKIQIGDSIVKKPNTYLYDVYRNNGEGKYNYFTTYDKSKIY